MRKVLKNLMLWKNKNTRPHVHIVLTDRGWIIEELSRRLATELPYVTVDTVVDPSASIQYYMTYSARRERVSSIEMALFTHREEDANAARRFDEVALAVDHAVSMSNATDRLVAGLGVSERSCISPGVDLDIFRPAIKIGVVGRTYHTGRKGEALVRAVMDVPDIEWHFTGEGWPGPAINVPEMELPAFYRSMDYVLVPATNEGGPMCVLEALACGTPIIASDVGWSHEFPHIPFERGDSASLRKVLMQLRAERFAMRESVENITWQRWVEEHDALFARLGQRAKSSVKKNLTPSPGRRVRTVGLVIHGAEDTTLGGPSVRVPRTKIELERLQLQVDTTVGVARKLSNVDIIHGFNIWTPSGAYQMARQAKQLGRPFVFSPILLDLSEGPFWQAELLRVFRGCENTQEAEIRLDHAFANFQQKGVGHTDFEPGYTAALCAINEIADATIFLSKYERSLFERVTRISPTNPYLVYNPVDFNQFNNVSPDLFRETYGLDDYVLCVGRIEHRKNQLMLATALASTELPLVLIGHEVDAEYSALIRRFGGVKTHLLGRIEPGSPLLRSAIAGARVFALPSWAEGAPLAALEAGAAGTPLVLSNRSSEREYFGDNAAYCDPANCASIRGTILGVWNRPQSHVAREGLRSLVRDRYGWGVHARATREVYEVVASARPSLPVAIRSVSAQTAPTTSGVIFDITTWANNASTLSGIVRVECAIARALLDRDDVSVRFVVYADFDQFVEVPRQYVESGSLTNYVELLRKGFYSASPAGNLENFSDVVTVGSSWMQNAAYSKQIALFARQHGLRLNVLMHDLTPFLFPQWYVEGYSDVWTANCRIMLSRADRVLVYSHSTARDVERFCFDQEIDDPMLAHIRLADEIGDLSCGALTNTGTNVRSRFATLPFVLAVGAIHTRKNYGLLFDVWTMLHATMDGQPPHLVIVGGVAWNGREIARSLNEDPRVKAHIHILEDVDDNTLSWLYEHCLLTVYPSLYEGWGLPVGESLARGRICLSSNISSMPEIAPALTDLLPPLDRAAWAARILHYARSASAREARELDIRQGFTITSWAKTAADVLEALREPAASPNVAAYVPGSIAICAPGHQGPRYLDSGWYPCEDWGVWSGSKIARLRMRLAQPANEDMVLTLLACVTKHSAQTAAFEIVVNDINCGKITFMPVSKPAKLQHSVGRIRIPLEVLNVSDEVTVEFVTNDLIRVDSLNPDSRDTRELGLGLSGFILEHVGLADDAPRLLSTRPEVRAMLKIAADQDLCRMLSENPSLPLAEPNTWCTSHGAFVQHGAAYAEETISVNGMLALAIGTARLRFDGPLILDLLVAPMPDAPLPTLLTIYANDEQILSSESVSGAQRVSLHVEASTFGKSDPLRLVVTGCAGANGGPTNFVLRKFRIGNTHADALSLLPVGGSMKLDEYAPELAHEDVRIESPLEFQLSIDAIEKDSVLLVDIACTHQAALELKNAKLTVSASPCGRSLIPVGELLVGDEVVAEGNATLTLKPAQTEAEHQSPGQWKVGYAPTVKHVVLRSLQNIRSLEETHLRRDGWHVTEDDGRCWGSNSTVSFWVRPEDADELAIIGEVLGACDFLHEMTFKVDGTIVVSKIQIIDEMNRIGMRFPLPKSDVNVRCIEIGGLKTRRPCDLGINGDIRPLSIALLEIQASLLDGINSPSLFGSKTFEYGMEQKLH